MNWVNCEKDGSIVLRAIKFSNLRFKNESYDDLGEILIYFYLIYWMVDCNLSFKQPWKLISSEFQILTLFSLQNSTLLSFIYYSLHCCNRCNWI